MGAFTSGHVSLIAEDQRARIGDSLDLDSASRDEHPNENRWDYVVSIPDLTEFAGIEPHHATDKEISVVVRKKRFAAEYLRNHLREGYRLTKWYWISSGSVSFSRMDKARRILDKNGIKFEGRILRDFG
jgi:hypothetical protein